ncbi:beta-ketoacyl synthase N-terminal-like domain-containing protein [Nocardia altamirensis]|uniref:beta-ketoacyl synthase N-terminal-like domain-containing protein n=1 Tax=Nocardia altamirensis TaxID=472158 RepID=UPI000840221D|nr:beta-ketoacyl synthase N-terminal-like domain-containing protein [Nocardia altamirensis]
MRTGAVITGTGWAVTGFTGVADLLTPGSAAGVAFDPDRDITGRGLRHKDRASRLALGAAERALRASGLLGADLGAAAVVVSSNFGNLDTVCDFVDTIGVGTVTEISPIRVPHMSSNVTACWVALAHGLRGPNLTLCSGTPSGLDAVAWARTLIAAGRTDIVVVVGVEPDTAPVARLHKETGADRWLDGAVALVVESADHAEARGAVVQAAIRGYGRSTDPDSAIAAALAGSSTEIGLRLGTGSAAPSRAGSEDGPQLCAGSAALSPAGSEDGPKLGAGSAAPSRVGTGGGPRFGAGTTAANLRTLDLTALLGRCSGALGVLQCAVGAEYLAGQPQSELGVLAVAGGPDDEGEAGATAAVLLEKPGVATESGDDRAC